MATKTTKEFAEIFGVTVKTVRSWIRGGLPVVKAGKRGAGHEAEINLEAGTRWYFERNRERLALDRERTRLASEQADKAALDNAVRRGELLSIATTKRTWSDLLVAVRNSFLALPTKVAAELATFTDATRIRDRLTDEVYQILTSASAYKPDDGRQDTGKHGGLSHVTIEPATTVGAKPTVKDKTEVDKKNHIRKS